MDRNIYPVVVDYEMNLEEVVREGRYSRVNPNINSKNFPPTRKGKVALNIVLIHLGRRISPKAALDELERIGYRPADLLELLVFGARYPDVQMEFCVVSLSTWENPNGYRYITQLFGCHIDYRAVFFHSFRLWCELNWRFAAIRKENPTTNPDKSGQ